MPLTVPRSLRRSNPQPAPASRPAGQYGTAALGSAVAWLSAAWAVAGSDDRHSRRVALLKRLLPATGLLLLLLITLWPRLAPLWDRMRLGFPAIDLRDARELRMLNPRYAGLDRLGRPYVVTAAVGRQVPDRQDLMSLEAPRADVTTHSGANIVLTSSTGVYQSQAQLLDLFGDVTMVHQNGTRFVTDTARINVAENSAAGSDPVEGHGPSGDIKAAGFKILDKGDTIIFTGKSDMLLRGAKPNAGKAAPTGLPAPVAAAAAQTAAAAKPILAKAAPKKAVEKTAERTPGKAPHKTAAKSGETSARSHHETKSAHHAKSAATKKS
ncbi:MAG TPA: LPS export ABC transporter periplasmic protein LptC [Stellaceae bacterium]|jgi:lipopolysaccharide export system protein LptC|nr:LPS export ABC transporter periplasmic protein LptC [Stellaceae bacterium]